jgi:hypothetical protein
MLFDQAAQHRLNVVVAHDHGSSLIGVFSLWSISLHDAAFASSPPKGARKPGAKREIIEIIDRVRLGDLGQGFAGGAALDGFLALELR